MSDRKYKAFTLVEMLVAMTITLLMMAAVAKAFAFVGERVRDSRGNLELSSDLRDITTRLNDELRRCTVSLRPNMTGPDQAGYFLYYEGPCTNVTASLFGDVEVVDGQTVPQLSRFGDLDDYCAFTAVATPGSWFTGKVPQFVLSGVTGQDDPVVIRSRYAEIVYFVMPERDAAGVAIDAEGDGIPDRLLLHRRVLLIRPDLNLNTSTGGLHLLTAGSDWQVGMAGIHQQCDLSVRRALSPDAALLSTVFANSLDDLTQPHNRFAHVRVPRGVLTVAGEADGTTMPILALEPPLDIIANASTVGTQLRPPDAPSPQSVVLETRWSGFLRREFKLGLDRAGEDVIANNCRAFDVQVFDSEAPKFLTSNNLVVGPNDPGFREVFFDTGAIQVSGGGFVDLCYPVLAGGSMRGWQARQVALSAPANPGNVAIPAQPSGGPPGQFVDAIQTPFSGLDIRVVTPPTTFPSNLGFRIYTEALSKSGRLLYSGGQVALFQPAFDTYTSRYETDGLPQVRRYIPTRDLLQGTYWRSLAGVPNVIRQNIDLAADGLDYFSTFPLAPIRPGTDDISERETSPPFTTTPEAIKISIRLESEGNRQLRQSSVVFRGER